MKELVYKSHNQMRYMKGLKRRRSNFCQRERKFSISINSSTEMLHKESDTESFYGMRRLCKFFCFDETQARPHLL